jgi:hypothetical protein
MKTLLFILAVTWCAMAQTASHENMVTDRGRTRPADETQTLDRGRLGRHGAMPPGPVMWNGTLVDAGCRDRSSLNLDRAPKPGPAPVAQPAATPHGITVDPSTLDAERADIMPHQVPDLISRQPDPACAITGDTRAFALLLDSGRLVDLDEGGNTFAGEAVQASAAGRAMLAGFGPGLKPRVAIEGRLRGDRLLVERLGSLSAGLGGAAGR